MRIKMSNSDIPASTQLPIKADLRWFVDDHINHASEIVNTNGKTGKRIFSFVIMKNIQL